MKPYLLDDRTVCFLDEDPSTRYDWCNHLSALVLETVEPEIIDWLSEDCSETVFELERRKGSVKVLLRFTDPNDAFAFRMRWL